MYSSVVGLSHALHLALLAVLYSTLVSSNASCAHFSAVPTDLPLCKSQVHLSAALSSQSLVFLQGPTHDTGSDCEVTVVAVSFVSRTQLDFVRVAAYEMPAAFHANAIVIE